MTAGIETLKLLSRPGVYDQVEQKTSNLEQGITKAAAKASASICTSRVGSLLTVFFNQRLPVDYESAKRSDTALFARFFHQLLSNGVYWPPSQFEAAFVSLAHGDEDIQLTVRAAAEALSSLYA